MSDKTLAYPTAWTEAAQPVGTTLDQLLYRVRHNDPGALIFDALSMTDLLDGSEAILFDALITTSARLQRQIKVIERVLKTAGSTLNVVASQVSDPFKRQGVINVAAIFELSDGQTITIMFHNPDAANVKSLKATDALISWKWLLNKRDITIVVAPEKGVEQPVRQIAQRIIKLAEKNSAAFARMNRQRAERLERIDGLRTEITGLEAELSGLQRDIDAAKVEKEERDMELAQRPSRALSALERIKGFLGLSQYRSMAEALSASETAATEADKALALAELIDTMATRMQQESKGTEATAYLRYQQGSAEHYIVEKDNQGDGTEGARGWIEAVKAIGDINIRNIVNGGGTLDLEFRPAVLSGLVDVSEPEPEIDPTTAEGYAKLLEQGDEALARYEDSLDAAFQQRLIDVRNALRALGWDGEQMGELSKNGYTLDPMFSKAGAGGNLVGVEYQIKGASGAVQSGYQDRFTMSTRALANQIDAAVPAVEPEPEPEQSATYAMARFSTPFGMFSVFVSNDMRKRSQAEFITQARDILLNDLNQTNPSTVAQTVYKGGEALWTGGIPGGAWQSRSVDWAFIQKAGSDVEPEPAPEPEPEIADFPKPDGYHQWDYYDASGSPTFGYMRFAPGDKVQQSGELNWTGTVKSPLGKPDQNRVFQELLVQWDNGAEGTAFARDLKPDDDRAGGGEPEPEIEDNPYWRVMNKTERARALAEIGYKTKTGRPNKVAKDKAALSWAELTDEDRAKLERLPQISTETAPEPEPEPQPEPEPTDETDIDQDKIARIDAAYSFASASDDFKAWLADETENSIHGDAYSLGQAYSPLATAAAMEERAKANGASVEWGFFGGASLDAVWTGDAPTDSAMDSAKHRWALVLRNGDSATVTDSIALDAAGNGYVGKISKGGEIVGRIDMGSDGKAMVFVGAEGETRVKAPSGNEAMYSDDDAPAMVDWLFAGVEAEPEPTPENEPEPEQGESAITPEEQDLNHPSNDQSSIPMNDRARYWLDQDHVPDDVKQAFAAMGMQIEWNDEGDDADSLTPEGDENTVKTAKGRKVATGFALVEAEDLIASHDEHGQPNPDYPAELQPRDRGRESSIAWVRKTAQQLDPDSLGKTRRADTGAPIVGHDRVVESGNGRTMAIREAYRSGHAEEYREWLTDEAESFGLNPERVKSMRYPVLVRVRTGALDRREFAIEANQDDKLAMTATEKARADADRLDAALLSRLSDGDLLAATNRDFVRGFLASLGDTEAAQYLTTDGQPTASLVARIQAAIFAKAYADDRLLELTADAGKPEIANIVAALNTAAPEFIRAQAANKEGTDALTGQIANATDLSLDKQAVQAIIEATRLVRQAKADGQAIEEVVAQGGLFESIDPVVATMAVFIANNNRSGKRLAAAFGAMARHIREEAERGHTVDMFGDNQRASMEDIIAAANRELDKIYGEGEFAIDTPDLFGGGVGQREPELEPNPEPEPTQDPQATTDRTLLQSVIDGTVADILSPDLADQLMELYERHGGEDAEWDDPALKKMAEDAMDVFEKAMMDAPMPEL